MSIVAFVVWFVRHQQKLRLRAHLMQEAIRNRDFTFRMPTHGLLSGERAMQETLNLLGETIRQQLNQNEVESWEHLTRVLTHEMMNATAPITSISQSLLNRSDVKGTPLEDGIRAIFETSQHMSNFVVNYRKMSELEKPKMGDVTLRPMIDDISKAYPQLAWEVNVSPDLKVSADAGMLRRNDGLPIPAENRQSLFVPFFTTKRSGSGIGLSLSRRMVIQQGGMLELADTPRPECHVAFILSLQY